MRWVVLTDDAKAHLERAVAAVEATDFEMHTLLRTHPDVRQLPGGGMETVGDLGPDRPVTVQVSFAECNGRTICFYTPTSRLVDWGMVEAWLAARGFSGRGKRDNRFSADDFHRAVGLTAGSLQTA